MPYIKNDERHSLDVLIANLINIISDPKRASSEAGSANYVVTRLLMGIFSSKTKRKYDNYALMTGVLENVKDEIRERSMEKYEHQKRRENGDLPEFIAHEDEITAKMHDAFQDIIHQHAENKLKRKMNFEDFTPKGDK